MCFLSNRLAVWKKRGGAAESEAADRFTKKGAKPTKNAKAAPLFEPDAKALIKRQLIRNRLRGPPAPLADGGAAPLASVTEDDAPWRRQNAAVAAPPAALPFTEPNRHKLVQHMIAPSSNICPLTGCT